jgi:hypothetical protein
MLPSIKKFCPKDLRKVNPCLAARRRTAVGAAKAVSTAFGSKII